MTESSFLTCTANSVIRRHRPPRTEVKHGGPLKASVNHCILCLQWRFLIGVDGVRGIQTTLVDSNVYLLIRNDCYDCVAGLKCEHCNRTETKDDRRDTVIIGNAMFRWLVAQGRMLFSVHLYRQRILARG